MKTLYESILDDIDAQMQQGDEWSKELEKKLSEFLKTIGSSSKYKKLHGYRISGTIRILDVENILNLLGFDGDYIELCVVDSYPNGEIPEWELDVVIGGWNKRIYSNDVLSPRTAKAFIKEVITPLTKDIDTFKKFLNNMEKFHRKYVNLGDLLK